MTSMMMVVAAGFKHCSPLSKLSLERCHSQRVTEHLLSCQFLCSVGGLFPMLPVRHLCRIIRTLFCGINLSPNEVM